MQQDHSNSSNNSEQEQQEDENIEKEKEKEVILAYYQSSNQQNRLSITRQLVAKYDVFAVLKTMNLEIKALYAYYCNLKSIHMKSLSEMPLNNLQTLDLGDNMIGDQGISYLGAKPLPHLQSLMINTNNLTQISTQIIKTMKIPNLYTLNISQNEIGGEGFRNIIDANLPELRALQAYICGIPSSAMHHLLNHDNTNKWKYLTCLKLAQNSIGNDGARVLSKCDWPMLDTLDLGRNSIGDVGVCALSKANWPSLMSLQLYINSMTSQGASYLPCTNWNLLTISISTNKIGDSGVLGLAKLPNHSLRMLDIRENPVVADAWVYREVFKDCALYKDNGFDSG